MNKVLEIVGLSKKYKDFSLDNVTFSINQGSITGFIGINGAGKTTTIKLISTLTIPDSGTIKLFGKELNKKNEQELKNRIGFVFDSSMFYEHLTIKQMKNIVASAYTNWDEKIFVETLKLFDLHPKKKIEELSKGMKMKFSLALAFSHHADIFIMDEPTSGLDPLIRSEFMQILLNLAKEGKTILFSSHITSDLDKVADHMILIHNGKICFDKKVSELQKNHFLVRGKKEQLNDNIRGLLMNMNDNSIYFEGIAVNNQDEMKKIPMIEVTTPSIEDIMLAYIAKESSYDKARGNYDFNT